MRKRAELGLQEAFAGEEQLFAHLWKTEFWSGGGRSKAPKRKGREGKRAKDAKAMNGA